MISFSVRVACTLIVGFTSCNIALMKLGSIQPIHSAMIDYGHCASDCWFQITPGQTTAVEAQRLLSRRGYQLIESDEFRSRFSNVEAVWFCTIDFAVVDGVVITMIMRPCGNLYVGDFTDVLGNPDRISYLSQNFETLVSFGISKVYTAGDRLSLYSTVIRIEFYAPSLAFSTSGWLWRGFAPFWRYRQLEGSHPYYVRSDGHSSMVDTVHHSTR